MKRILMASLLAVSTLGLTGAAMAADNGNTQVLDQAAATQSRFAGNSDGSFARQQALQYNTDNGQ